MTEDQIERRAERMMDSLDSRFTREGSTMTQAEYDAQVRRIEAWVQEQAGKVKTLDLSIAPLRVLYGEACHGAGADPRWAARQEIERRATEAGFEPAVWLGREGFDLGAYFASRPIA